MNIPSPLQSIRKLRDSIAYLTSKIILVYVALGIAAVALETTNLPGFLDPIKFENSGTARALLATFIASMISLVVFSFSMVMSVLTQAGSNFSNKLVFSLMTEKRHQHVLGHYLGTILYILILLLVPVEEEAPDTWRSLAVYLSAAMVIHSLVLFVFFIHATSQSVQINAITQGLLKSTQLSLKKLKKREDNKLYVRQNLVTHKHTYHTIRSRDSGYIQSAKFEALAKIAQNTRIMIHFNFSFGDFVVKDFPIIDIVSNKPPGDEVIQKILNTLEYVEGESTKDHYINGLTQLMEVAVKSLSPGINDPGTARLCIHQITELLSQRLNITPTNMIINDKGECLVSWHEESFESLIFKLFNPILHYGKKDLSICLSLLKALKTLSNFADNTDRQLIQAHADRIINILADHHADPLGLPFIEARMSAGIHHLDIPRNLPKATGKL
ncbi:DUF2254 domain-containing protein [Billgrantia sp. C5P2]|uniref:DUF2254 domain-containing protein n=1 Tax=Billgrantia sp. C5P2 TaxID=3436239 RepID=UPI003DA2674C